MLKAKHSRWRTKSPKLCEKNVMKAFISSCVSSFYDKFYISKEEFCYKLVDRKLKPKKVNNGSNY